MSGAAGSHYRLQQQVKATVHITDTRSCFLSSHPCSHLFSLHRKLSCFNRAQLNTLPNTWLPSVSLLCHIGCVPKLTHTLLSSPFSHVYLADPSMGLFLSFLSGLAHILQMPLCAGWGPIQQGDESIQPENYVMCHLIDWPRLLVLPPPGGVFLRHRLTLCSFNYCLPSFNHINSQLA